MSKGILGDYEMLNVLKYIWNKNNGICKIKYLFIGMSFQIFKRLSKKIISKTIFNGKNIFLYPNCNVSSMYAYTDIPDREEILLLREFAKQNNCQKCGKTIFLDIGANIGSYSISMIDVCDSVIAFEPHPYTSKRYKMNFLLNNLNETLVKQLALSDSIGSVHFSDYGGSSTVNHIIKTEDGIEVQAITLDKFIVDNNFAQDNRYIVKIDVEGFEEQVLKGGRNFFTQYNIQAIVFECFSQNRVFDILKTYGFTEIKKLSENNYCATKS